RNCRKPPARAAASRRDRSHPTGAQPRQSRRLVASPCLVRLGPWSTAWSNRGLHLEVLAGRLMWDSPHLGAFQSGREAEAVRAHLLDGDARMALHDDELAAGVGALGQACQPVEIAGFPDAAPLGNELRVREIAGIPMDVIVEQVAVALGDAGVERVLRPRD